MTCRLVRDHLHIRGEYCYNMQNPIQELGSPPHTWRIHKRTLLFLATTRITSTYVENTYMQDTDTTAGGDHLHIRGEYAALHAMQKWVAGSPPHTWRIQYSACSLLGLMRITSTYVENTNKPTTVLRRDEDHLHIRGEYSLVIKRSFFMLGSPPHTWRIPIFFSFNVVLFRITSTYVENTNIDCIKNIINRDHLHIRGEYPSRRRFQRSKRGSPPHTWRIHNHNFSSWIFNRITSTYVENTMVKATQCLILQDHLHIRGEYGYYCYGRTWEEGSPPHTWRIQ